MHTAREILSEFCIHGSIKDCVPYGSGHINDTFHVRTEEPDCSDFLLQKMNSHIFSNIPAIMNNIEMVTSHLQKKTEQKLEQKPEQKVLIPLRARNGSTYVHSHGAYWRICEFLEGFEPANNTQSSEHVYRAGYAFGKFVCDLSDFPAESLCITIPNFHNLQYRLNTFYEAQKDAEQVLLKKAAAWIATIHKYSEKFMDIHRRIESRIVPQRVVHNDAKFDNVLLEKGSSGFCVVDLDTIMPGTIVTDFGDSLRSGISTCAEDETDLTAVDIDITKFQDYSAGYFEGLRGIMTAEEGETLPHSGGFMAFIMGLRFLTDYVMGNVYYKIHYEDHNLVRAACQLTLSIKMLEQSEQMRAIISKLSPV